MAVVVFDSSHFVFNLSLRWPFFLELDFDAFVVLLSFFFFFFAEAPLEGRAAPELSHRCREEQGPEEGVGVVPLERLLRLRPLRLISLVSVE